MFCVSLSSTFTPVIWLYLTVVNAILIQNLFIILIIYFCAIWMTYVEWTRSSVHMFHLSIHISDSMKFGIMDQQ
jgi:hypothetical protein